MAEGCRNRSDYDRRYCVFYLIIIGYAYSFNLSHLTGKEAHYMYQAVYNGKLSGNGEFTKRCQQKIRFQKMPAYHKLHRCARNGCHLVWHPAG